MLMIVFLKPYPQNNRQTKVMSAIKKVEIQWRLSRRGWTLASLNHAESIELRRKYIATANDHTIKCLDNVRGDVFSYALNEWYATQKKKTS